MPRLPLNKSAKIPGKTFKPISLQITPPRDLNVKISNNFQNKQGD